VITNSELLVDSDATHRLTAAKVPCAQEALSQESFKDHVAPYQRGTNIWL